MANENRPNSNQSQFFVTLAPCEWLNRKHTVFGKVTGNTIFNVIRLGGVEIDENDRPVDEIKIIKVEVLWNPFDDIIPRFYIVLNFLYIGNNYYYYQIL
jgi:peptidyl-prolyl cis-trans isomerase SDCCAG10